MNSRKLMFSLLLLPLVFTSCGGGTSNTPTSPVTPTSSSNPGTSEVEYSSYASKTSSIKSILNFNYASDNGDGSYHMTTTNFELKLEPNEATAAIEIHKDESYVLLPAGSKFTFTLKTDYYLQTMIEDITSTGTKTTTYSYFVFAEAVDPSVLNLENATGRQEDVNVYLTYASDNLKTFSFVPSADVKLSKFSLCALKQS